MPEINEQNEEVFVSPLSNEVQEIISHQPNWVTRNGILLLLLIFCCMVGVCWFIRYPDVVQTKAKLTSINAPKPIVTVNGGKLVSLMVQEGQQVAKNAPIGFIESPANHLYILGLEKKLDSAALMLNAGNPENIGQYVTPAVTYQAAGELQPAYQTFYTAFLSFRNYLAHGFYLRKKQMLAKDLGNLRRLNSSLDSQKVLQQNDLSLTQQTFDANMRLKSDKVISDFEYRGEQSKLIGKQMTIPQINSSIIGNESQQNEKLKEIMELDNTIAQQKAIFGQALQTFKSQVQEWKQKFVLTAPISGKISFATFLQENQQLQPAQTICFVNPGNSSYYAEMVIPQYNFGKVAIGQKVLLKFTAYPFQEFGSVYGKIDFISRIPSDSGYLAKIVLPNGLATNYKKEVQYHEGLSAQAEIITIDMRLLQRFYNSIAGQLRR